MIVLYHGTRRDRPAEISFKGLLAHGRDVLQTRNRVLEEFGLAVDQVPDWTWKHEAWFRNGRGQHGVFLTTNASQAAAYSYMGGGAEFCIREAIICWLRRRSEPRRGKDKQAYIRRRVEWKRRISEEAAAGNGRHRPPPHSRCCGYRGRGAGA